jgi:tetratricopeptide (TPR) repeat protein
MRLAFCLAGLILLGASGGADDPEAAVRQGSQLREQGRLAEALRVLDQAVQRFPTSGPVYAARARVHASQGNVKNAVADATRATELAPRDPGCWTTRGLILAGQEAWARAEQDFDKALSLKEDPSSLGLRGRCRFMLGRYAQALADYSLALQSLPEDRSLWDFRGETYGALGQWDKAVSDYTQAVRLVPTHAPYRRNRAGAYFAQGEYRRAVADLSVAIENDRKNALNWTYRATVYRYLGEWEYVRRDAAVAIALDGSQAPPWYNRGLAYARLRHHQEAEADFGRAIALAPEQPNYRFERALMRLEFHDLHGVLDDALEVTRREPVGAPAWNLLGICQGKLKRWDQALEALEKAVRLEPKVAEYWYNRGSVHVERGEWQQAAEDFAACLKQEAATAEHFRGATVLALYRHDQTEAAKIAQQARARFIKSDGPEVIGPLAGLLGLLPGSSQELESIWQRLTKLPAEQSQPSNVRLVEGLLLYRLGRHEAAVQALQQSVRSEVAGTRIRALLVLALAKHALNQPTEAAQHLQQAETLLATAKAAAAAPAGEYWSWEDRLGCEFLLAEAKSRLEARRSAK